MKTRTITSTALLALLALTACSGDDATEEQSESPDPTEEATEPADIEEQDDSDAELEALIERENDLFAQWAATEPGSQEEAELEADLDALYDEIDELFPDAPDFDPETFDMDEWPPELQELALFQWLSEQPGWDESDIIDLDEASTGRMTGDITAGVGEPVDIDMGPFEGVGDYMGTLTLDEVSLSPSAEVEGYEEITPKNEHFLVATFIITADEDAEGELSVYDGDFRWGGFNREITDFDTYLVQDSLGELSDPVRPGESTERTFIFDIPEVEGTLIYRGATHYVEWDLERDDYSGNLPPE